MLDQVRHRLSADPLHTQLTQEHALCTYKDANFPADKRYHQALAILAEIGLGQAECRDKETLGQGGAIYKRLWETTGLMAHLHTALVLQALLDRLEAVRAGFAGLPVQAPAEGAEAPPPAPVLLED